MEASPFVDTALTGEATIQHIALDASGSMTACGWPGCPKADGSAPHLLMDPMVKWLRPAGIGHHCSYLGSDGGFNPRNLKSVGHPTIKLGSSGCYRTRSFHNLHGVR